VTIYDIDYITFTISYIITVLPYDVLLFEYLWLYMTLINICHQLHYNCLTLRCSVVWVFALSDLHLQTAVSETSFSVTVRSPPTMIRVKQVNRSSPSPLSLCHYLAKLFKLFFFLMLKITLGGSEAGAGLRRGRDWDEVGPAPDPLAQLHRPWFWIFNTFLRIVLCCMHYINDKPFSWVQCKTRRC
jgi:hypothetical protein